MPRCRGLLAVIVREPERNTPLQAVNGRCLRCGHRMAWIVIRGYRKRLAKYDQDADIAEINSRTT